ncbi:MAG: FHA domain-containing protein [Nitrospirota bacterium]
MICPECKQENMTGALFCDECGAKLTSEEAPVTAAAESNLKIVLKDSGQEVSLPDKAEIIMGREDPVSGIFPDVDFTPFGGDEGGVSRLHAKILKEGDVYKIEDLGSTNATVLNKQRLSPHTPVTLKTGDEIRFGKVAFEFKAA